MTDHAVTFRLRPRGPVLPWASLPDGFRLREVAGGPWLRGRRARRLCALRLLAELRETHRRATVFVDGRRVNGRGEEAT